MITAGSLVAEHVSKRYRVGEPRSVFSWRAIPSLFRQPDSGREILALDDVSFRIEPGEAVGLIGPNGTGKSTLLRVLTGITAATSGQALSGGRVAGVLDLGSGFYEELSAVDNTYLNAQLLGMSRQEVHRKIDDIFQFAELTDFVNAPMRQFSFGMRLRLAFSIAMALQPDILLLDEVLGVGDLRFQRRSAARIQELLSSGVTLILVSHQLTDLARVCRRGLLLEQGRLAFDGEMQAAITTYLASTESSPTQLAAAIPAEQQGVTIVRVDVLGETGLEQQEFRTGEAITVRVAFRTSLPLDRPNLVFSIHREDGVLVSQPGTDSAGVHTGRLLGDCEAAFTFECPFQFGGFRVSVAVTDASGKQLLAQANSAAGFEVRQRSVGDLGAVRLDGQWTIQQASS